MPELARAVEAASWEAWEGRAPNSRNLSRRKAAARRSRLRLKFLLALVVLVSHCSQCYASSRSGCLKLNPSELATFSVSNARMSPLSVRF